jgi:hypothetical protein
LEGLHIVSETDFFFTLSDTDQKSLMARLALRPWTNQDVKFALTIEPNDFGKYLKKCKLIKSLNRLRLIWKTTATTRPC